ncbi:MAG: DUF2283 domain-containing protein [Thermoplasmata archaeon]
MRVKLDAKNKNLYFKLAEGKVAECEEVSNGVILDYDKERKVIGIEIANDDNGSSLEELSNIEFELAEA